VSSKYYKEKLKKAIEQAAERLFHDSGQPEEEYLYLTRRQYESDPDGWHSVLRQRGLPDDAIVIIPDVFDTKEVE
jgi:hypothetical protein